ncbi:MAG: hypothetical protein MI974_03060 [Chitinophagales bacterium]|nr:hypothetical protein [Chitinophagales bacterium]
MKTINHLAIAFILIFISVTNIKAQEDEIIQNEHSLLAEQKIVSVVLKASDYSNQTTLRTEYPTGGSANKFGYEQAIYKEIIFKRVNKYLVNGYIIGKIDKLIVPTGDDHIVFLLFILNKYNEDE